MRAPNSLFLPVEGSVVKFTDRVTAALLGLESRYTRWPKRAERERIAEEFEEEGIPGGCVGAIDGCHMVLYARPGLEDHKDFLNRKDRYSYNVQAVAGFDKRITHLHVGHPGSSHDMRVFAASQVGQDHEELFHGQEFLIADGGYQALDYIVPVFREDQMIVPDQVGQYSITCAQTLISLDPLQQEDFSCSSPR